jgi:transposase-like protein
MAAPAHPPEVKAAVLAALLTGQRVTAVAEQYHIPKQTVSEWHKEAKSLLSSAIRTKKVTVDISGGLNRYLEAALAAIAVQTEVSADRPWLKRQDASSFAVLHGVMVDKIIRLLEAAEAGREQAEESDPEAPG